MTYNLNTTEITIEIIRKKNKNIYMRFQNSHTLIVSCNRFVSETEIKNIIKKNEKTLIKMQKQKEKEEVANTYFQYLGQKYTKVYDGISKDPYFQDDCFFVKDEKTLEKFYKSECQRIFKSEVERIVPYFENIPTFTIKIRTMKTRWGVNNRTNNTITLNSELLKKDLDLIDYVIIHELCHFYEANHSSAFWNHVSNFYPKYKEARKRLRG